MSLSVPARLMDFSMNSTAMQNRTRESLLDQIEQMAQSMMEQLDQNQDIDLVLIRKRATLLSTDNGEDMASSDKQTRLRFPGNNSTDAWRFAVTLRLLDLIHESLAANVTVSKRDMYYRDPALFVNQDTVNRYIEDIARTLQVKRSSLNITAALKGLLSGPICLHYRDGSISDLGQSDDGMLIPNLCDINLVDLAKVEWVLVIEKEATFRTAVTILSPLFNKAGGLLITAKGYPDQLSKDFVHMLSNPSTQNAYSSRPIYTLVDFDPDGYGIHACYKQPLRQATTIKLLGLTFEQLLMDENEESVLTLTMRDRTRARNMLKRELALIDVSIRLDVQRMLLLNQKTELQHLSDFDGVLLNLMRHGIAEWRDQ